MNTLLQVLVSIVSLILSAIILGSTKSSRDSPDKAVAEKAKNAYNSAIGLLLISLGGLIMSAWGWMGKQSSGYGKSLYDYLGA